VNHHNWAGATAVALCLTVAPSAAQNVGEFEFVSVRRSPPQAAAYPGAPVPPGELRVLPDGRLEARGQSLANLARVAFGFDDVDPNRGVVQTPADWMWKDRFDVTASAGQPWTTPRPGTTVPAELRTMLHALLEDRFALQARIATKKVDVTALRLVKPDKLGPGLRPSAAECRGPFTDASAGEAEPRPLCPFTNMGEIQAQAVTMPEVAQLISQQPLFKGELLVDQTALPGRYDVSISFQRRGLWTREVTLAEFEARLGLRLKGTSVALPTLIIERAEKPQED
jgi:uncharacterized protein (TIGR03435 family)